MTDSVTDCVTDCVTLGPYFYYSRMASREDCASAWAACLFVVESVIL